MACHVFKFQISEWNKHFSHKIYLNIFKKLSSVHLKNTDKKEEKKKYKGNCKVFCIKRKGGKRQLPSLLRYEQKQKKTIAKCFALYANVKKNNKS